MKLARAGYLSGATFGSWQWTSEDRTTALIQITGARDAVTLRYRVRSGGDDWESFQQRVPIRWTPCRFGGERPWFVCDVSANGAYCGRQVAKLYGVGRPFACRHCYRLGYGVHAADQWIAPITAWHGFIGSSARTTTDRTECPRAPEMDASANV
jgi:hypothetical protein